MNWKSQMEVQYANTGMPYNSIGSFVDFFGGVAYDHLNFIFSDTSSYVQESVYPSSLISTNLYKYGSFSPYYDCNDSYVMNDPAFTVDDLYNRPLVSNSTTTITDHHHTATAPQQNFNSTPDSISLECPRHHLNNRDEVVWQDNIDLDNMTYEELLELGEAVGTQTRGLSEDDISLLPVSKFKRCIFSRKRSRHERCVICQMEYKRGEKRMTLPCKHLYHASCCKRWLGINKACPICYTEVVPIHSSNH